MNIRQIRYYVATAETGQVSRAALAMNISQSSVTAAIKALEAEFNTPLFARTSHGMELTAEGRELLGSCYEVLQKLDEARQLTRRPRTTGGKISIAATYTVIGYFLPYHLERLRRFYPALEVQVHELNREAIEEGLATGRYDLAIMLTSNTANPALHVETLLRSARRLWLPNGHPLSQRDDIDFGDIAREPYIMLTIDEAAHTAMRYWTQTHHRPDVQVRTSSVEAVRSMVANGSGVTILSDMVYRPWSLEGRRILTMVPQNAIPTMDVGLAWGRHRAQSPAAETLIGYFRQLFLTPQNQVMGHPSR